MNIAIGSDHAGYEYKKAIIEYLTNKEHKMFDMGTNSPAATDYPDYALKVANSVKDKQTELGILICGTGIGMSISANKVKGIRAALVTSAFTAESAKSHNFANVITFGSRTNTLEEVLSFIDIFMKTKNSDAKRHIDRVEKITKIEDLL